MNFEVTDLTQLQIETFLLFGWSGLMFVLDHLQNVLCLWLKMKYQMNWNLPESPLPSKFNWKNCKNILLNY